MTTTNRYAPPKALLRDHDGVEAEMWREGKVLAMRRGGQFPHRCIKCKAPAVAPGRRQRLSWHPPCWHLLILLAVLLYLIVALIVRKTATVEVGLCERHQKRVLWGRIVGWGGFVAMLALGFGAATQPGDACAVALVIVALPWIIATILLNRLLIPHRIDATFVRVKGCDAAFLGSLPDRARGLTSSRAAIESFAAAPRQACCRTILAGVATRCPPCARRVHPRFR